MCLGLPMQVQSGSEYIAKCLYEDEVYDVDTTLIGEQPPGTWLLVFLGSARQVLTEQQAHEIANAIKAVSEVMSGGTDVDHLFSDLAERKPQLPKHLQPQ